MCDGCMANLGHPPPVAVCEHSAAMLALPSPPSPHTYAPPSPPYAHTLWWGAATIRAGHADTAHLHLLIKPIVTGHGSSGRRSTGRGGSCAAGRQLQHMLRRRHNVGVAPRKASHEQQTAKPSSTTHQENQGWLVRRLPRNFGGVIILGELIGRVFVSMCTGRVAFSVRTTEAQHIYFNRAARS